MFCQNCGAEIPMGVDYCTNCGSTTVSKTNDYGNNGYNNNYGNGYGEKQVIDNGSVLWAVLGFFIPLAGLILFLVWKDTKPRSSKNAGMGALISVIISALFYILAGCASFLVL